MKNFIFICFIFIILVVVYAINNPRADFNNDKKEGIQFYRGTWAGALALAKKENKPVFLDVYAPWCGPCKKLKKNTFSDEQVGAFFNSTFINVSLNGETGEGALLCVKYNITGYPALLFIDQSENIMLKSTGYQNANELLESGKSVLDFNK